MGIFLTCIKMPEIITMINIKNASIGVGVIAQSYNTCLAYTQPWVPFTQAPKKKKKRLCHDYQKFPSVPLLNLPSYFIPMAFPPSSGKQPSAFSDRLVCIYLLEVCLNRNHTMYFLSAFFSLRVMTCDLPICFFLLLSITLLHGFASIFLIH